MTQQSNIYYKNKSPNPCKVSSTYCISLRNIFTFNNTSYYKPHSQPSCGIGGSCNRGLLNHKKRRV